MPPIIFIVGATATGKTEIAYQLACQIKGEIISCDSMAFYKEPFVITSKPPRYMLDSVKHHFVGMISVKDSYSVFDYYIAATEKIKNLFTDDIPVVVCGGSGLYFKALLDGVFKGAGVDLSLRKNLEEKAQKYGKERLHEELRKVDPQTAGKVNDLRRIIRALEVYRLTGVPLSLKKQEAKGLWGNLPIRIFGLNFQREKLYERINERVDNMFEAGAVQEVEGLLKLDLSSTSEKIIGIKEISGYLKGEYNIEQAKELMKKNTRNFAKRQLTWFKADKRIEWISADDLTPERIKENIVKYA
ncbi:MAG: tRNA (adenosine(37)-N6)-dimethylallyltransferase MiaA [Candidatus Omnitrophica bacterium]|jgi:tRNA dimethylallyltransferase|nr:tRNA (adenosine(37)-N6)-dimethylallyltransferase MiaA [Candidatus Omnitrophota bacterium]